MFESIINWSNIDSADVVILSAPYGKSFTYRSGAENGPKAIVDCLHGNLEFYDRFVDAEPVRHLNTAHHELAGLHLLSPADMVATVRGFCNGHRKPFILALGGDHSISIGRFASLAEAFQPSEVTIVQIDAHPDLRNDPSDYQDSVEKYSHACTMRRAIEFGFKTCQVGIRTYSIMERDFMREQNLTVFEWGRGTPPSIAEIISSIKTESIYLTIDADGLDPAHMPAVGTPVPGGLEWYYCRALIRELCRTRNLIGADLVEVSPVPHDVVTQYAAAQLCYDVMSQLMIKKLRHGSSDRNSIKSTASL